MQIEKIKTWLSVDNVAHYAVKIKNIIHNYKQKLITFELNVILPLGHSKDFIEDNKSCFLTFTYEKEAHYNYYEYETLCKLMLTAVEGLIYFKLVGAKKTEYIQRIEEYHKYECLNLDYLLRLLMDIHSDSDLDITSTLVLKNVWDFLASWQKKIKDYIY